MRATAFNIWLPSSAFLGEGGYDGGPSSSLSCSGNLNNRHQRGFPVKSPTRVPRTSEEPVTGRGSVSEPRC